MTFILNYKSAPVIGQVLSHRNERVIESFISLGMILWNDSLFNEAPVTFLHSGDQGYIFNPYI